MKRFYILLLVLLSLKLLCISNLVNAQCADSLGWTGTPIIQLNDFVDTLKWHTGASAGDTCYVSTDSSDTNSICLNWTFNTGVVGKHAQMYYIFDNPVSLSDKDIFSFDIKGQQIDDSCNNKLYIRLKFENSTYDSCAVFDEWENLNRIDRWCENISVLKNQFRIDSGFSWNRVKVVSLEVFSKSPINLPLEGVVCFKKFTSDTAAKWTRTNNLSLLNNSPTELEAIKETALDTIIGRQVSNGLLCTWHEDNYTNLYGLGPALKILSIEGQWDTSGNAVNDAAATAKNLADFLIDNIELIVVNNNDTLGFWPRSWRTSTGAIISKLEAADSTVWLGDNPWILTGLQNYYNKSSDQNALKAINRAKAFTDTLIDDNGKLNTFKIHPDNNNILDRKEVTSTEAYSAVIQSLLEVNDTIKAVSLAKYIDSLTWNDTLKYWKESIGGNRVVLFANTWFSQIIENNECISDEIDPTLQKCKDALSFVGRVLYTKGPGSPVGFDGIGPIATWFEGTLTYICAGGPGSQCVFDSLINYIEPAYAVPHYNDVFICGESGIWAVEWISLDGTCWLYFAASKSSPFIPGFTDIPVEYPDYKQSSVLIYPNPATDKIIIETSEIIKESNIIICNINGQELINQKIRNTKTQIDISNLKSGMYFVKLITDNKFEVRKIIIE